MIGLDILLMNMTSFALNIWTKFSSQNKNGQSLKNLAWITWRRNSFKFESFCLRDVITKAPLSYRVSVANLMTIKKFANRKYEKSRDIKRKLTLQYSSWARALNNYVNYNLGLKGSQNLRKRAHHISFINCSPQTQPKNRFRYETTIWFFLRWCVLQADPKKPIHLTYLFKTYEKFAYICQCFLIKHF